MSIVEKIKDIEKEIGRTQINKATMSHLCSLRARLAKLRTELLAPPKGGSADAVGFDVEKVGDARVALIGFPSVGKSTILRCVFSLTHNPCFPICHTPYSSYIYHRHFFSTFTTTKSEAASYEFTTLTCIPGVNPFFSLTHSFPYVTIAFFPRSRLFISCFFLPHSHPFFPACHTRILAHTSPLFSSPSLR